VLANAAYLSRFLFSGLQHVAPYCAPGGARVVSNDSNTNTEAYSSTAYLAYLQHVAARMNRCQHGCMNGYSEDLRRKIVSAVERGMSNSQAARTFDVSLSSLKRSVKKADHGESLAPKKSPGSLPKLDEKARRLLSADLQEHIPTSLFRSVATTHRGHERTVGEPLHHVPRHSPHRP
jgi:transposase